MRGKRAKAPVSEPATQGAEDLLRLLCYVNILALHERRTNTLKIPQNNTHLSFRAPVMLLFCGTHHVSQHIANSSASCCWVRSACTTYKGKRSIDHMCALCPWWNENKYALWQQMDEQQKIYWERDTRPPLSMALFDWCHTNAKHKTRWQYVTATDWLSFSINDSSRGAYLWALNQSTESVVVIAQWAHDNPNMMEMKCTPPPLPWAFDLQCPPPPLSRPPPGIFI